MILYISEKALFRINPGYCDGVSVDRKDSLSGALGAFKRHINYVDKLGEYYQKQYFVSKSEKRRKTVQNAKYLRAKSNNG